MFFASSQGLEPILRRKPETWFSRLRAYPRRTLARTIYSWRPEVRSVNHQDALKVVCVSDTHNHQPDLPPGDILIHAGDLSETGTYEEIQAAFDWLNAAPHTYKIVIAGNHDTILAERFVPEDYSQWKDLRWGDIIYLQDSSAILKFAGGRTIKVFGTPWTRRHGNGVFQYRRGEDRFTNVLPEDSDIIITHGPPLYYLDLGKFGDEFLLKEIWRIRPQLHVFGHIHEGHGKEELRFDSLQHCYENILKGAHGYLTLIKLLWLILLHLIFRPREKTSLLVNAAAVGGFWNRLKSNPVVVYI